MKGRKTGGRKKGAKNKRTLATEALVKAGIEPLEVMLANMRHAFDEAQRLTGAKAKAARNEAQNCARDAAPYCHHRLASIEHTGKDGGPIETREVTDETRAKALAVFLAKHQGQK